MALANTAWDSYSDRGFSPSSIRLRPHALGTLVASAVVASCLFAAVSALHARDAAQPSAATTLPPRVATRRVAPPHLASLSPFEKNVQGFLGESLLLTRPCGAACGIATEIAEARGSGRLGLSEDGAPETSSPPTGFHLQQRFALQIAEPPAALPALSTPAVSVAAPLPPPVRIEPSVVVPLPAAIAAESDAPVPAARLDRSAGPGPVAMASGGAQAEEPANASGRPLSPAPALHIGRNDGVAIYDISSATVYMPDGQRLEAHSGLGQWVDNPRFADRKNVGPTPPNVYNLVMRKGRFHGVEALRLIPADGDNRFGRVGLLAHTYLLRGRPAESNGCVAFKDYSRFLDAFKRGSIKRLMVVPHFSGSAVRIAMGGNEA